MLDIKHTKMKQLIKRLFCIHNWNWIRNVYGDETYMTGEFKRSWWRCNKCNKTESRTNLHYDDKDVI